MAVAEALPADRAPRWRGMFMFGESRTLSAILLLAPAVLSDFRLALLDRFRAAVHKVADFSRIEG